MLLSGGSVGGCGCLCCGGGGLLLGIERREEFIRYGKREVCGKDLTSPPKGTRSLGCKDSLGLKMAGLLIHFFIPNHIC